MKVSHEIEMDLVRHSKPAIHVVQGDAFSRRIRLKLLSDKVPWCVPRGVSALVRYKKPNKECGIYDTLPDGSSAFTIYRNYVTITITPDVLSHPGEVSVIVSLILGVQELSTFELLFDVQSNYCSELREPDSATSVTGMLSAPASAEVGQFLVVEEVNERGKVLKTKAVDMPSGEVEAEDLAPIIAAYLEENPPTAGEPGTDGKTAYEVALDNGFEGSEEEWLESLKGEPGADGQDGTNGSDGKSAYKVAVENGFVGSEEEWLESLIGPAGPEGPQGEQGPQGEKGDTGIPGHTPVKGTDYWTEADKTALVNDVLAALPTWTGGSY